LFAGDSRVIDIAAKVAGTKIVTKHRTTISETTMLLNLRIENKHFPGFFIQSPIDIASAM
jgi:hypothetical protein